MSALFELNHGTSHSSTGALVNVNNPQPWLRLTIHSSTIALVSDTVVGYIKTMFEYCALETHELARERAVQHGIVLHYGRRQ